MRPLVLSLAVVVVATAAGVARADVSKGGVSMSKLPASARVFVLDKDAPPTEKTAQLPRTRPSLKQKF